jgi:hypothetical protein
MSERKGACRATAVPKNNKRKRTKKDNAGVQTSTTAIAAAMKTNDPDEHDAEDDTAAAPPLKKPKKSASMAEQDSDVEYNSGDGDPTPVDKTSGISSKKKPRGAKNTPMPTPPDSTIQAFLDAIPSITSWSSPNIRDIYCDIIKWTDKDHKGAIEIAETYHELGNGNQDPTKVTVNRSANIYKLYDKWAPKFYQEKGVGFVSLRDRRKYSTVRGKNAAEGLTKKAKISKPKVNKGVGAVASKPLVEAREHSDTIPSQTPPPQEVEEDDEMSKGETEVISEMQASHAAPEKEGAVEEPRFPPPDQQFYDLFEYDFDSPHIVARPPRIVARPPRIVARPPRIVARPPPIVVRPPRDIARPRRRKGKKTILVDNFDGDNGASEEDVARFYANRNSQDLIWFKRKTAEMPLGDPSRPVLDRQAAAQYSGFLRDELGEQPDLELIEYADSVNPITIFRFVACISPTMRANLPTHDLVEVEKEGERSLLHTRIQWSMIELQVLYLFALQMKCEDVLDMILDRFYEDFHRPVPRVIVDAEYGGKAKEFDILDISPQFMNIVAKDDPHGLDFFTSVLVLKKRLRWKMLAAFGLENWSKKIKSDLREKSTPPAWAVLDAQNAEEFCQRFHHHKKEDVRHECYRMRDVTAQTIAAPEVAEPSADASKQKPARRRLNMKLYRQALYGKQDDSKKRKRDVAVLDQAEQDRAAEDERAEKRHKREQDLEGREAAMKFTTLAELPNLAYPVIFRKFQHTLERKKEPEVNFFHEGLGNAVNKAGKAKQGQQKQLLLTDKLQEFIKFHKTKDLNELYEKFGLNKNVAKRKDKTPDSPVMVGEDSDSEDDTDDEDAYLSEG